MGILNVIRLRAFSSASLDTYIFPHCAERKSKIGLKGLYGGTTVHSFGTPLSPHFHALVSRKMATVQTVHAAQDDVTVSIRILIMLQTTLLPDMKYMI
ncbi:hypothetical protein TNCV_2508891 [Trichonephila clavipes]|nr:hypothetical protein TNCV_2508891 [Trichonephila clavipes]